MAGEGDSTRITTSGSGIGISPQNMFTERNDLFWTIIDDESGACVYSVGVDRLEEGKGTGNRRCI